MILVTGVAGFVGGISVRLWGGGKVGGFWPAQVQPFAVGDLLPDTDWTPSLCGLLQVVHTAARVHLMADKSVDPLAEFRCALNQLVKQLRFA